MVLRYKLMSNTAYQDEVIILKVKDWQTADKYAVCFSRAHGKIPFLAYGVADDADVRVVQPLLDACAEARVNVEKVATMQELGKACGIHVGAATAAILKS